MHDGWSYSITKFAMKPRLHASTMSKVDDSNISTRPHIASKHDSYNQASSVARRRKASLAQCMTAAPPHRVTEALLVWLQCLCVHPYPQLMPTDVSFHDANRHQASNQLHWVLKCKHNVDKWHGMLRTLEHRYTIQKATLLLLRLTEIPKLFISSSGVSRGCSDAGTHAEVRLHDSTRRHCAPS